MLKVFDISALNAENPLTEGIKFHKSAEIGGKGV